MEFRHQDTKRADGTYVKFQRVLIEDPIFEPRDKVERRKIITGELIVFGVQAEAAIVVVRNGVGTHYNLKSAGCWGVVVTSSRDPYLDTVYAEEHASLKADLAAFSNMIEG